jgi:hypothetical protein
MGSYPSYFHKHESSEHPEVDIIVESSEHKNWVKFQYIRKQLQRLPCCPSGRYHPGYGPRQN